MKSYSNVIVLCLGLSLMLGGMSKEYANNTGVITGASVAAVFLALFDLFNNDRDNFNRVLKIISFLFLFISAFAVTVIPHLTKVVDFIKEDSNRLTVMSLGIVIGTMAVRHMREEREHNQRQTKESDFKG
jgi:hypothetical protein